MKVLGSILILVVAMHSQCLNACPLELYLAAASAEPPCHHANGSAPESSNNPGHRETNACGFGLAVEFKSAPKVKSALHASSLDVLQIAPLENNFQLDPAAAPPVFNSRSLDSSPPRPQRSILRI